VTAFVDIANRALSAIGTRSTIQSLSEVSNEAIQCNLLMDALRKELLRLAPWNCATNWNSLALLSAAPGTPENPSAGSSTWQKGQPPPPWAYEYMYPTDCLRPLWVVPQFTTGFAAGVPITTAVTGGFPSYWNGPPIRFKVAIDQVFNGVPSGNPQAVDTKVVLTNQEFAVMAYLKNVTDPNIMDDQFLQAWVAALAGRIAIPLTGDKGLANMKIKEANDYISLARQGDGNEGLTVNDVTPDWIRIRGTDFAGDWAWSPSMMAFEWGPMMSLF
jgi:hypothetical protein